MKEMKKMKMKINQNNKLCESCKKIFPENELDLHNGKWLCNDCEEYIMKNEL